jgi:Domain of unknown function (DUF202)
VSDWPEPLDEEDAEVQEARGRTVMAWARSSMAFFALGVAVVKFRPLCGFALLAFSAAAWLVNRRPPRRDWDGSIGGRLFLVSLTVVGLAVVALILTLAGPLSAGLLQ